MSERVVRVRGVSEHLAPPSRGGIIMRSAELADAITVARLAEVITVAFDGSFA